MDHTSPEEVTTTTTDETVVVEDEKKHETGKKDLLFPTVHNIYNGKVNADDCETIVTRSPSTKRSKINRLVYAKLHRNNHASSAVDKLKGKYENASKKTKPVAETEESSPKEEDSPSLKLKPTKPVADTSVEKTGEKSPKEEESPSLKLKPTKSVADTSDKKTGEKSPKEEESPSLKLKPTKPVADTSVEKTEEKSPKEEESPSLKLKPESVEHLKTKYSPANFGYPRTTTKIPKKVQFFNDKPATQIPVPKPRATINKQPPADEETVVVEVKVIEPEEPSRVYASTSTLNSIAPPDAVVVKDENSNHIEKELLDEIDFAEPEEKHFIVRASSSEDSVTQFENTLSEFVMEPGKAKEKKRSGSFRKILSGSFFGGKDKKKSGKKQENCDGGNSFNRNTQQRHTIGGSYGPKNVTNYEQPKRENDGQNKAAEELFAQMHINKFNDIRNNFARYNTRPNFPAEEYVSMDNHNVFRPPRTLYSNSSPVDKYIDTSSSTSTLNSEKQPNNTYENSLIAQAEMRQVQQNENLRRALQQNRGATGTLERFTETPPRAYETYQNLQLVKPKAVIPISSERALPNPYQNGDGSDNNLNRNDQKRYPEKPTTQPHFEETYGTVFDSLEKSPTNRLNSRVSSPRSPSLEGSKLRLPSNRERIELQPRIKSPIPQAKISTDKIIATELLKAVRSPTPTRKSQQNSPSHQRLEIQIDYPEAVEKVTVDGGAPKNSFKSSKPMDGGPVSHSTPKNFENKPPISPKRNDWAHSSPNQVVANALVHAESNDVYRATTPINQRLSSSGSVKSSPEKHEIRQQVEAYCWKELKKLKELKEQEERDLYYYQLRTYGYADDGVLNRRSRSLTPSSQRGGLRSLSLPREVAPGRSAQYARAHQQAIPEGRAVVRNPIYVQHFVRNSPERRTIGPIATNQQQQKPIFNRGSLTNQNFYENQSSLKKVSFSPTQKQDSWPTRNGYTQSPPQRRLERQKESNDDEVFVQYQNDPNRNFYYTNQPQVKMEEIYVQKTVTNDQLPPIYTRQNEPIYIPKQIRVSNKICDNYGQIHDTAQKTGVVYGQLQQNPVLRPPQFVRGSRLTASANDMYKRYQNVEPRYRSDGDVVFQPQRYQMAAAAAAPNRPLPPVPSERSASLLPLRRTRVSGK